VDEVRDYLGVDSLHHLSMENLVRSCRAEKNKFCTACFDGEYPIDIPESTRMSKFRLEETTRA
jgi:amidophosphoribosyltransferase